MAFGCTEFCWWLQGYFALTSSAELTDEQEREILSNLRKARQSIDPYDRAGQRDFESEAIVTWLCSRMDTFEEIKQPVPAQIVAEAKKRLSVYTRPTTTNKR
jgi:hypothetical protein